jgi:hypothetical protein
MLILAQRTGIELWKVAEEVMEAWKSTQEAQEALTLSGWTHG